MSSRTLTINECTLAVEGDDEKRSVFQIHAGLGLCNPIVSISSQSVYHVSFPLTPMFLLPLILALQVNLVEAECFMLATFLLNGTDGGKGQSSSFNSIKEGWGHFKRPIKRNQAKVWGAFH